MELFRESPFHTSSAVKPKFNRAVNCLFAINKQDSSNKEYYNFDVRVRSVL